MPLSPEGSFEPWPATVDALDRGIEEPRPDTDCSAGFDWPDFADGDETEVPAPETIAEEPARAETVDAIEQRVAEAYAAGQAGGRAEGRAEGEAAERLRLRNAFAALDSALGSIQHGEARWREALEENLVALAIAIAKQILEREVKVDRGVVEGLVRRAVSEFPVDQPVRVRLAPTDIGVLADAGAAVPPADLVDGRAARWIPDPLLTPGGCVVEGRERIVDGRVDSALERIYRQLTHASA